MRRDGMVPRRLVLAALPAMPAVAAAQGEGAFPARALRAIVPFPPGSAIDGIAFRSILGGGEGKRFSLGMGLVPAVSSPEELARFQAREIELWGRIAQAANLPKE